MGKSKASQPSASTPARGGRAPNPPRGGRGATATNKRARVDQVPPLAGYDCVIFETMEQRDRFQKLEIQTINSTRWLDASSMRKLGLHEAMAELFRGTGFTKLYGMALHTYPILTLEFLSSLAMDEATQMLTFRVDNIDHEISLDVFGEHLGLTRHSRLQSAPAPFKSKVLWGCISDKPIGFFSNVRVNHVQHPVIKLWLRTIIGTFFGRHEVCTMNSTEAAILGSYLNVQRQGPFHLDLPYLVAKHWLDVAQATKFSTIEIGGLITHLCDSLNIFDVRSEHPKDVTLHWIDLSHLEKSHHWLRSPNGVFRFQVTKSPHRDMISPCARLPRLTPLTQAGEGEEVILPSYLIPVDIDAIPGLLPLPPIIREGDTPPPSSSHAPFDEAGPSHAPPPFGAQPSFNDLQVEHFHYMRQQFTQFAVNQQLVSLPQYHRDVQSGEALPPYPTYYRGSADPSGIFEEAHIDRSTWGRNYGDRYGGFGGHLLDQFGRFHLGGNDQNMDDDDEEA